MKAKTKKNPAKMVKVKIGKTKVASTSDREILISRDFDARRDLVWEAWTNPKHVAQWWGPNGFTTTIEKMDVRPGGVWKHVMHGPDGTDFPNKSVFKEVVKPERISYSHGGGHKGGRGATFKATWTFEALSESKTRLTIQMVFRTAEDRDRIVKEYGALEGANQTLSRLGDYLKSVGHAGPKLGNGKICYLEIPAVDVQRSSEFYAKVFGWKVRRRGDGALAFDDGVGEVSGAWVTGRPPMSSVGLLIYVMVDSVAATVEAISAEGCEIVQAIGADAPEITARFRDPAGNVLGLYQEPSRSNT